MNAMDKQSFLILVDKVVNGTATEAELTLYNQYFNYFQEPQTAEWDEERLGNRQATGELIMQRIQHSPGFATAPARRIPLYRRRWVPAAAVILVLLTSASLFLLRGKASRELHADRGGSKLAVDLLPAGHKATLTLADGSTVDLDAARDGAIASQGNTRIMKLSSGQLAYRSPSDKQKGINTSSLNTLSTPYGGRYQLTLSDGSLVWLNSGSSLRFPASFTGGERVVELSGEAYFEIVKNGTMPFKVKVKDMETVVLGTSFNIMAYEEEKVVKTSLLEGSVRVQKGNAAALLTPGQQSQLDGEGVLRTIDHADMEEALAWKNGLFDFESADIQMVMRQLARWYNVEVTYEGQINQHFTGKIDRNVNISKVLQMLELTEKVHFTIEGRKIIVSQI